MRQREEPQTFTWRLWLIVFFISGLFVAILWRFITLTVTDREFLLSQGNARSLRDLTLPAYRGMLLDRNNSVLAVSTPVMAVWVSPKEFKIDLKQLIKLAKLLKVDSKQISKKINKNKHRQFLYLKRELSPQLADRIKALKIPNLYLQKEYKRFYPLAEVVAPVIGLTNIDDSGIEGLELAFNQYLSGEKGIQRVIKDRLGRIIDRVGVIKPPKQGQNINISLDKRIQFVAFNNLKETVETFQAKSGTIVVLDVANGEILAMANYPSFNPNKRIMRRQDRHRNRAVTDLFEPGSVMKAFSVASALDSGLFSSDTLIDTAPNWMKVGKNIIKDEKKYGVLSVTQILKRSSNVGVTKMVLSSPASQLESLLRRVGFGRLTESSFPGESGGVLEDKTYASPFVLATLGFGYGLSVTTLQLAQAYAVFANGGFLVPATFIPSEANKEYMQVIDPKIAKEVLDMLEAVVEKDGTGRFARIFGYRVAGKTGTSRIATKAGYDKNKHIASFVGIAPVSKPKLVVAVVIQEPTKISYYGGRVAAPLFSKVMGESLRIMGISPDKINV